MKNKGISLVALVITIIVLLILAGVTIGTTLGSDGIIAQARFSKWITEYRSVEEAEKLKETRSIVKAKINTEKYAITNNVINVTANSSLDKVIKEINGTGYTAQLYEADISNLNIKGTVKRQYAVDIKNGTVYDVLGYEYNGMIYHTPETGVDSSGNVIKDQDSNNSQNTNTNTNTNTNILDGDDEVDDEL